MKKPSLTFWLFLLPLLAAGLLWAGWPAVAAGEEEGIYREGLQHLFPYYVPEGRLSQASLSGVDLESLSGSAPADQVFNFGQRQLELNRVGGTVFATALYSASGLDPLFNENGRCGLAAWQCDGQRWLTLQAFSSVYELNYLSLRAQLLFVKFELTSLSDAVGAQGSYQAVYDDLRDAEDFSLTGAFFMQNYLGTAPARLETVAQRVYGYNPEVAFNQPEVDPEAEPEAAPEVEPIATPSPPANGRPSVGDCSVGLSSGYIAVSTAGDQGGPYLLSLTIVRWQDGSKTTTTLAHRCLRNSLERLLQARNSAVSVDKKLGGWVWRSNAQQIERRMTHCGSSNYDIYEKPANDCSPPTARPGRSSHQLGLAIDFYCEDGILTRNNCAQAFDWLNCNAASYGLINLPSETWHWYYPLTKPERLAGKLRTGC